MHIAPVTLELPAGAARLAPLAPEHAPALLAASRDPDTWRYLPDRCPANIGEMTAWVAGAIDAAQTGAELPFAIIDRCTGSAVGSTRYLDIQPANRSLEIGSTWLGPSARRTSINTECKYLLMRHAFESLGAIRVSLKTDARNERSQRAILRIGACYEGRLRNHRILADGFFRDSMYYSVLSDEWPRVRARLEARLGL